MTDPFLQIPDHDARADAESPSQTGARRGPLAGVRLIEFAAIGPTPFCGMLLADLGADVLRIDRTQPVDLGTPTVPGFDVLGRGRRSVSADLKKPETIAAIRKIVAKADMVIEGFRPGVMERLGLGPQELFAGNPKLVYGRITGWGQEGPLSQAAGHDINYIAITGALHAIGPADKPAIPLNVLGDYAGGSLYLALGLLAALHESKASGKGQVVDAAIVDGVHSMMTQFHSRTQAGNWRDARESNLLDGGAAWYGVYGTADGKYVSIGTVEAKFFRELMQRIGLDPQRWPDHRDPACWPDMRAVLAATFKTRTRDEWTALLEGTDACFAPVLDLAEARQHMHNRGRGSFVDVNGVQQPMPAPRFSRTPGAINGPAAVVGQGGGEALAQWGFGDEALQAFPHRRDRLELMSRSCGRPRAWPDLPSRLRQ